MRTRLYAKPECPYCERARAFLAEWGAPYVELDVTRDEAALRELMHVSGRLAVPVLVAGYYVVVGFDRQTWTKLLAHADAIDRHDPCRLPALLADDPSGAEP
jgi:glutaredoxin